MVHVPSCDHPDQSSGQTTEDYKSQAAIERFAEGHVPLLASTPELVDTGKNLLDFVRRKLVPLDMQDIVVVPLKPRDHHTVIVAECIYKAPLAGGLVAYSANGQEAKAVEL